MKRNRFGFILVLLLSLPFIACVDETPTDVGDALLSGHDVVTFELVLPASGFLVYDTAFSGYVTPIEAPFDLVARRFENVVDANTLLRFSLPPRTISVRTTGSTVVVDSFPHFASGKLVLKLDTTNVTSRPIALRLFRTIEEWNASATWTNRVDTVGVQLPWTQPGGTRGAQIDTATWATADSVVFSVDSATLALWNDSTNRARGAIVTSETDGSRAHILSATVHVAATSTLRPDTVVNVDLVPAVRTFVYNPELPKQFNDIRVGGVKSWRSILRMRPDLRLLVFPCSGGPAGCTVSLDSVHINTAELLLPVAASPPGFTPEDSLFVEARTLNLNETIPLERTPVGERVAVTEFLAPNLFRAPVPATVAHLNITGFIVHLLDESVAEPSRLAPLLALIQVPEGRTFGFASFGTPSLRLVLTTSVEKTQ